MISFVLFALNKFCRLQNDFEDNYVICPGLIWGSRVDSATLLAACCFEWCDIYLTFYKHPLPIEMLPFLKLPCSCSFAFKVEI